MASADASCLSSAGRSKVRVFSGVILPGGADWQSVRVTDGVARLDARYTLRHDDGTLVTC